MNPSPQLQVQQNTQQLERRMVMRTTALGVVFSVFVLAGCSTGSESSSPAPGCKNESASVKYQPALNVNTSTPKGAVLERAAANPNLDTWQAGAYYRVANDTAAIYPARGEEGDVVSTSGSVQTTIHLTLVEGTYRVSHISVECLEG